MNEENNEIGQVLRSKIGHLSPVQIAELLEDLDERGLTQSSFTFTFKHVFPEIPLRVLIECGSWPRLTGGNLNDEDINKLLNPWLDL